MLFDAPPPLLGIKLGLIDFSEQRRGRSPLVIPPHNPVEFAYKSDGVVDDIYPGNDASLNVASSDFTVSVSAKLSSITAADQNLINKGSPGTSGWRVWRFAGNKIYFSTGNGITYKQTYFDYATIDEWVHVTAIFNGTHVSIYKNGIFQAEFATNHIEESASDLHICHLLIGSTKSARLWNRALSAAEALSFFDGAEIDCADEGADNVELWDAAASVFTAQDVTINNVGGYATGVNSMTVDPLPLTLNAGTKLTFAGGGEYIITTLVGAGATTILSTSGLTGFDVADGEASPSGCYAWVPFNANTIANVSNALEMTYVDHMNGGYVYLRDSNDLSADMVVGKRYRVSVDLSYTGGASAPSWQLCDSVTCHTVNALTGTPTTYTYEFIALESHHLSHIRFASMVAGNVITIDNLSLKRIGCVMDLGQEGMEADQWDDQSGNDNHGTVTGAVKVPVKRYKAGEQVQ